MNENVTDIFIRICSMLKVLILWQNISFIFYNSVWPK